MLSVISVEFRYATWHNAKFRYAEWHNDKCHYAKWHNAKCHYAECRAWIDQCPLPMEPKCLIFQTGYFQV